jgi:hypothetical protein
VEPEILQCDRVKCGEGTSRIDFPTSDCCRGTSIVLRRSDAELFSVYMAYGLASKC